MLKSRNFDPTIPHGQGNEPRPYLRCLSDLHHVQHENLQCILLDLYEESLAPLKEGLAKKPTLKAFIKEIIVNGEKTTLEEALERAT